MFIFTDKMSRNKTPKINEKKQIVFTDHENESVISWLKEKNFPSHFFEDMQNEDQSITYEEVESIRFIVTKYVRLADDGYVKLDNLNVSLIQIDNKLICTCKEDDVITEIAKKFEKRFKPEASIDYYVYTIMDILVDNTVLMVDVIDSTLEDLEENIMDEEYDVTEEDVQKYIYFARRTLNRITKYSIQKHDLINKLYNSLTLKEKKNLKYEFGDLKEHTRFLINEGKSLLDRTGYLLNLHMGSMSNKMNKAMQRLAAISIIFLPLTFIVGNYGMNFKIMPELDWEYGYYVVTILNIVVASGIFWWLKREKWI